MDKVKSEALYFFTVLLSAESALSADRIIFPFVFESRPMPKKASDRFFGTLIADVERGCPAWLVLSRGVQRCRSPLVGDISLARAKLGIPFMSITEVSLWLIHLYDRRGAIKLRIKKAMDLAPPPVCDFMFGT